MAPKDLRSMGRRFAASFGQAILTAWRSPVAESGSRRAFVGNSLDRPVPSKTARGCTKNHSILEPVANRRPPVRLFDGNVLDEDAPGPPNSRRLRALFVALVLALAISVEADSQTFDDLVERYEEFLLFKQSDYQDIAITKETFRDVLMSEFNRAVRRVSDYPYDDPLRDPGGTPAAALTNAAVTNSTVAPTLNEAEVDGAALTLTYTKRLDQRSVPLATDYSAMVAGSLRAVTVVDVSGSRVILTLASAVTSSETVTVSYTVPTTNAVRDAEGTEVGALTNQDVTNTTAAPTLTTAAVDGAALTLTYSEALDGGFVPLATDYAVTVAGSSRAVTGVGVSGSAVILRLASVATSAQTVTLSYMVPTTNALRDVGGTEAAALTNHTVTNGTAAPTLTTAAVDGAVLTLTYSEALDEGFVPLAADYAVTVAGSSRAVTGVDVNGSTVILRLASVATSSQTVTLSYTVPATNALRDLGGTQAVPVTNHTVTNDTAAPTLDTATVDGAALTLTYTKALDDGAVPLPTDYAVTVAGSSWAVTDVDVIESAVWLTLESAVTSTQTVAVSYTVPATNALRDLGGTQAGALTNQAVTNSTATPTLRTAAVRGAVLTLTYSETMDVTGRPEPPAFTVTVAGSSRTVTDVDVSGSTVTLRLESAVTSAEVVTVSYTLPVKQVALFVNRARNAPPLTAEEQALEDLNDDLHNLFNVQVPRLVFAYLTPGVDGEVSNPHYQNPALVDLYVRAIEHSYLRGLTENAWLPDHAGNASLTPSMTDTFGIQGISRRSRCAWVDSFRACS